MEKDIKVSIIMGVFNGEKTVSKAVESILNQSYQNFELIICDDASQDSSYRILNEIASKDSRIILIKNDLNLKLSKTLNKCIEISKGTYIARMDDDDYCDPNRIKEQVHFLDENKDYDLVGTSRMLFDEEGVWGIGKMIEEPSLLDIFQGKSFVHPSIMIRKSTLQRIDNYSDSKQVERVEDYDLWCKVYKSGGRGYNLQKELINYYEGKNSFPKRKLKYRLNETRLKLYWRKEFRLNVLYCVWCFKPLLVAIIPTKMLKIFRTKILFK